MRALAFTLFLLLPGLGLAQEIAPEQTERDRSYLTGLIEDNLSGAGREIRLDGFAGALSSRATFDTLTIADENGVWITLRKGALAWDRGALLTGRIAIDELSAAEIDLARLPGSVSDGSPAPEAKPFALPDLPVSVKIGKVRAEKLHLGAPVLGQEVALRLEGALSLAGGEGSADLKAERIDGTRGQVALKGSYANGTRQLLLDLLLDEGPKGIAATLIGLPDQPALTLSASGVGPIDDFAADILLSTDGARRLSGKVAVKTQAKTAGAEPETGFSVQLAGDVSPLLAPEYRGFFGEDVTLAATGARTPSGMLSLSALDLRAKAIALSGQVDLLPSGLPERFGLDVKLGLEGGADVLLPLSGEKTWLRKGTLRLNYDRTKGDGWKLTANLDALRRNSMTLGRATLSGSGRIGQPALGASAGGTLRLAARDLAFDDPALAKAVGTTLTASTVFHWQEGKPLNLPVLHATAQNFAVDGRLSLADLAGGIDLSGQMKVRHEALETLSALAGRALSGQIEGRVSGQYTLLTGAFDATLDIAGQDLHLDQPQADALLAGAAQIALAARRDETGLTLRKFTAQAAGVSVQASGTVSSEASDLAATLHLPDLARLGRGYGGALNATATLSGAEGARRVALEGEGVNLAVAQAELNRILAGESRFSAQLAESAQGFRLASLSLAGPQLSLKAKARDGAQAAVLDVNARLANAALLAPGFPGPVAISGNVRDEFGRYKLDLSGTGPGNTRAKVAGTLSADFANADLALTGGTETALANAFIAPMSVQGPLSFDLRLAGKPGLSALSGQLTGTGLRFVAPRLGQKLENITLRSTLANGSVQIDLRAQVGAGGTLSLSGPVNLSAPFASQLSLVLDRARLRDPELYDTQVSGQLAITGPLTGGGRIAGALSLSETELRIPSSGLSGAAAIPDITHRNEPAAVHATRQRAGLIAQKSPSSERAGASIGLDITVSAPRQIFVRGRGLDAELGGSVRLTGSTANIVPAGQFNLIRGRLDVLGKRFTLTEGQVAMQGALVPWILFKATTEQDDVAITLAIEGNATEPALHLTSSPELPEEEVLARLLFNKGLSNLSALQAAQLASAVATLAGKGGEGIVSRLRQGFGLDDLDVGTDESGNATVRAGKYLSENIYSDVAVDSAGKAEINLNLDISSHLTARGTVGSTGESSLGLFFEKDY